MESHRAGQDAPNGGNLTIRGGGSDPLEHAVERIGMVEDVARRSTVAVFSSRGLALSCHECQRLLSTARLRPEPMRRCFSLGGASNGQPGAKSMKFRPLHDRVVIRRIEGEEKTKGGIIIPDTAKEKPQEGEVVAVGPGARDESGRLVPPDVKAGDRVLFGKWSGAEVKIDGEDLLIMKESDVMGVIEGASATKKKAA
jgi:chaperonin GroES